VASILGGSGPATATGTYTDAKQQFDQLVSLDDPTQVTVTFTNGGTAGLTSLDPNAMLVSPLTGQTGGYYSAYLSYTGAWQQDIEAWTSPNSASIYTGHILPVRPSVTPAPVLADHSTYSDYLTAYWGSDLTSGPAPGTYMNGYTPRTVTSFGTPAAPTPPTGLAANATLSEQRAYLADYANYMLAYSRYFNRRLPSLFTPPVRAYNVFYAPIAPSSVPDTGVVNIGALPGNAAANVPTANNPLPVAFATLLGGESSSYRIVSGADVSSANPLALQPASTSTNAAAASANLGNVVLSGHTGYVDSNGLTLVEPVTIRTGKGSIDVAAGNDVSLFDTSRVADPSTLIIPGVIYTAGAPAAGAPPVGLTTAIAHGNVAGLQDVLVTSAVNPDSAGDITIHARRDIKGMQKVIDANGTVTGNAGNSIDQYWWQWMQITGAKTADGNTLVAPLARTSIDFGAFDQGVMSVGGNVSLSAGGNISDLAVSLPTTWYKDATGQPVTVGGGNLSVRADGDILSGTYFVAKGAGVISAGGSIGSDIAVPVSIPGQAPVAVSTILATQDGVFDVTGRQGVELGAVLDPSYASAFPQAGDSPTHQINLQYYGQYADSQGYSPTSSVNVSSTTGDIRLGAIGSLLTGANGVLPASVNLTAFSGGIDVESGGTLFPSALGQLNLIADRSVRLSNAAALSVGSDTAPATQFGLSDADPSTMPSPTNPLPVAAIPALTDATLAAHARTALHGDDATPARIYSVNGSIVNGVADTSADGDGFYRNLLTLSIDKPSLVQAGQDIVNLAFWGQNLRGSDVTRIVAGRDIYDTPTPQNGSGVVPVLSVGGPGWFDVQAGRNIGPLTSQAELYNQHANTGGIAHVFTGIDAVGNANNPNLPHQSANLDVLFGVGPGIDVPGFVAAYVAPGSSVAGVPSATPALIAFMEQYDAGLRVDTGLQADHDAALAKVGRLTAAEAWKQFQALPSYVQQRFAQKVLFGVLAQVGADYNDPSSPYRGQYARGYQAINTLFPGSLGYTANSLGGGSNGANRQVATGNLDIRSTTIQTQQGGDVTILGPGGQALVGSTTAPPQIVDGTGSVVAGPGTMGILTLEKGNVDIFTDQSVLLAQSRIFTEQGGDMTIWSSSGDINAGKGAKTAADTPAPQYVCDANHYCTVDARGQVTGAGIATLQSIPGAPKGTVNLIAPRGTVDAGDAGIRAGNLNVAALHVVNADNIQVTGTVNGIPLVQAVNTGALTAASSAASAASQAAQDIAKNNASGVAPRRWTISVQVEGFGDNGPDGGSKRRRPEQVGYDSSNSVSLLGFGAPGATQKTLLSKDELAKLNRF
ncbi:MAG: filamentous hemagglutinin family protein, partial [Burkholderia vietnamiensis]|nr:filamentous hemagglutinin family protein [Burkholderia vietnamiensis]